MTKRNRKPMPRKPETTPIDLPYDDAALIFTVSGGVQLLMTDSDECGEVPFNAGIAAMLWARLNRDAKWAAELVAELEAWAVQNGKLQNGALRLTQKAAAPAKSRSTVMEGASHAIH